MAEIQGSNESGVREEFLDQLFQEYTSRLDAYIAKFDAENKQIPREDFNTEYMKLILSLQPLLNVLEYNILRKRILLDLQNRKLV